ncbi:hypothetical protein ACFQ3B_00220 [Stackebrandtia endophytica]|uniref:hypothetical protein n=1 Tax=Stackebrandtia endophytica TaxID=1496996 RepID=UPI0011519C82|nr:hypothetical protein [Stackebrandtia endophytica]
MPTKTEALASYRRLLPLAAPDQKDVIMVRRRLRSHAILEAINIPLIGWVAQLWFPISTKRTWSVSVAWRCCWW